MRNLILGLTIILGIFSSARSIADEVELPPEELAKEAVLPKFDQFVTIRNRNIVTANKIEAGVYYGFNFAEPIYNQSKMGFNIGYHWNEASAIMMNYALWNSGLNTLYTNGLQKSQGLDFTRAPDLLSSLWFHYEHLAYYGKISITKEGSLNLSMYPILGVGTTAFEHKSYFGLDGGIGLKVYFTKAVALRVDLKMQYGGTVSPFLIDRMKTSDPVPRNDEFHDVTTLSTIFDVGLSAMF